MKWHKVKARINCPVPVRDKDGVVQYPENIVEVDGISPVGRDEIYVTRTWSTSLRRSVPGQWTLGHQLTGLAFARFFKTKAAAKAAGEELISKFNKKLLEGDLVRTIRTKPRITKRLLGTVRGFEA